MTVQGGEFAGNVIIYIRFCVNYREPEVLDKR